MSEEIQEVLDQDAVVSEEPTETGKEAEVKTEAVQEPEVKPKETVEERPVWTMPVKKAQEEKRAAVEKAKAEAEAAAKAEIERVRAEYEDKLKSTGQEPNLDAELDRITEAHGLDKDAAKSLLEVFKKSIKLPDLSKYEEIAKQAEAEKIKSSVRNGIDLNVVPLIKKDFPDLAPDQIAEIAEQVHGLAFSEEYKGYRLQDIYKVNKDDLKPKSGFTVEPSRGRAPQMADFSNLSDEEEHALAERDPEAFKKYLKFQATQSSRFVD